MSDSFIQSDRFELIERMTDYMSIIRFEESGSKNDLENYTKVDNKRVDISEFKCFETPKNPKCALDSLLFFESHGFLVSCSVSRNKTMVVFLNLGSGGIMKCLEEIGETPNEQDYFEIEFEKMMSKIDDNSFVVCTNSGDIFEYSVEEMSKRRVIRKRDKSLSFRNISKLGSEFLIAVEISGREIVIISFSTGKIAKKFDFGQSIFGVVRLIPSRNYHQQIYLGSEMEDDGDFGIKLFSINVQNETFSKRVEKEFFPYDDHWDSRGVEVFNNEHGKEILVVGTDEGIIYFYDTTQPSKSLHFRSVRFRKKGDFRITRFFLFRAHPFLAVGEFGGKTISLLDLKSFEVIFEGMFVERIVTDEDSMFYPTNLDEMNVQEVDNNRFGPHFVVCVGTDIFSMRLKLKGYQDLGEIDTEERTLYLKQVYLVEDSKFENEYFKNFELKIGNYECFFVFKSLLY